MALSTSLELTAVFNTGYRGEVSCFRHAKRSLTLHSSPRKPQFQAGRSRSASSKPHRLCSVRADAVAAKWVKEVDINTYDATLEAAGDKLVVLYMYTQWCGPCKLIAPKLEALAQQNQDVVFLKLDCNEENKRLAKSLGIKSVPTFKLLRHSAVLTEVVGAKYDALVAAIVANNTPPTAPASSAGVVLPQGGILEVDKDSFYSALSQAGSRLVVLDMYTDWCGPCKLMDPKVKELAAGSTDVVFLKLNCNQENKPLAKSLGVVTVPTFKFFKGSFQPLDEVRGAKFDLLLEKIAKYS